MLKYEGFNVGDKIRAYDFEQRDERGACYIEGEILLVTDRHGYKAYLVRVTKDVFDGLDVRHRDPNSAREMVYVPMETWLEFEGRVTKIEEQNETPRLTQPA